MPTKRTLLLISICGLGLLTALACGGGGETSDGVSTDGVTAEGSAPADGTPADGATAAPPTDEGQVYKYTLAEISPSGDHLPPLDGGRIEFAPPKGWHVGSRQSGLVCWFHEFKDPNLLPQIRVNAEDVPEGAPQNATVETAKAYAEWVESHVREQIGDEKLLEPVVPLVLGENAFGRYVRAGKYKSTLAERQILVTTVDGRVYTIELIVFENGLKDSRKAVLDGYSVGGNMKASEGSGVGGFELPGESE